MTTDRPYRRAMTPGAALDELSLGSGSQFEPRIVEALRRVVALDSEQSVTASRAYGLRPRLGPPLPADLPASP